MRIDYKQAADFLRENDCYYILTHASPDGDTSLLDLILGHKIDLVIDIPSNGIERSHDGFIIRRHAIETGVNVLTSMDTANALLASLESAGEQKLTPIDIAAI